MRLNGNGIIRKINQRLYYGWLVVGLCFLFNLVVQGSRYSYGVFFKSIETEFSLNRGETSAIFSANMVLCCIFGVLGGWAQDRYGPRLVMLVMGLFVALSYILSSQAVAVWQLYIVYSLLLAVGTGAVYPVAMSTASRWFIKKRGLALGISGAGVGAGTLTIPQVSAALIASNGWRPAFLVLGIGCGLVIFILSRLVHREPASVGLLPDGLKTSPLAAPSAPARPLGLPLSAVLHTSHFWIMLLIWLCWSSCVNMMLTHTVPHVMDLGFPQGQAAVVLGVIGASSLIGRLSGGRLSDLLDRRWMACACALLQAAAMFWLLWAHDLWALYLFAGALGFGYGAMDPPTLGLIGDRYGVAGIGAIFGVMGIGWSLGAAVGPSVAGFVFDSTGGYYPVFLAGALALLVAAFLLARTRWKPQA